MKRTITLLIALVLIIALLSLTSSDSTTQAQVVQISGKVIEVTAQITNAITGEVLAMLNNKNPELTR